MIFITSYPYIGPRHIRVFDFFKKKDDLVFILPEVWKMKGGKVVLNSIQKPGLEIIPIKAYFFHSNYPVIRGLMKGWMPGAKKILKRMAHKDDVLYTAIEPNLLVTYFNGLIAKKLGLKHVFFTWQNVSYKERLSGPKLKLTEWLLRKNIALSKGAICGNSKALDILRPYLPFGFKTIVAPISGVDTEQFRPDVSSDFRNEYRLKGKTVLTFIGALDKRKGIDNLLNSFLAVSKIDSQLHLVMGGAGILDEKVKQFISQHALEDKITLFPWLDNDKLPGILSSSDIFIYPSEPYGGWEEQFGYSIAEASLCGLPIISTNSGSIADVVINGESGLLITPGSQKDLEQAITTLASDQRLRKKMGERGRRLILENYSHEIVANKMENFLRNL